GPVDRTVDAAAAEQRRVRGVDDRVDALRRDVTSDNLDHGVVQALRQRPNTKPPRVKPRPKVPTEQPPIATALRHADSRCQWPSASRSPSGTGSPRRCLRSAPPARSPRYRSSKISDWSSAIALTV